MLRSGWPSTVKAEYSSSPAFVQGASNPGEHTAPGTRLHAADEGGIAFRAIAETIGEGLGVPVRSIAADDAPAYFD